MHMSIVVLKKKFTFYFVKCMKNRHFYCFVIPEQGGIQLPFVRRSYTFCLFFYHRLDSFFKTLGNKIEVPYPADTSVRLVLGF